jgi:hypothetical protein
VTKMIVFELTDDRLVVFSVFMCLDVVSHIYLVIDVCCIYLRSGKVECALFGSYVDSMQKMMGKSVEGLPVVVVQFAKIMLFRGFLNCVLFISIFCVHEMQEYWFDCIFVFRKGVHPKCDEHHKNLG